jgi:hypothetical protein
LQFLLSTGVIAVSGIGLAPCEDVFAEKSQLGGTWVEVILVAAVTSRTGERHLLGHTGKSAVHRPG